MDAEYKEQLEKRLSHLLSELSAMRQTYKAEIEYNENVEMDFDAGVRSLEDAFKSLNRIELPEEEDANSSAANYKDYMAEERATTDRGN